MFYNRTKETERLIRLIKNRKSKNSIVLLAGNSGVGKSGLTKKILSDELKDEKSIRVHISKSSIETIENLCYFNGLYKEIVNYSKQAVFDSIPSPTQIGIMSLKNILHLIKSAVRSKIGLGEKDVLFEPVTEISLSRKLDYIIKVLNKCSFIIVIENIQNIDTQSSEILQHIVENIQNCVFIFEYTLVYEDTSETNFMQFYQELLEWNAEISPYIIEKLPFDEARKLAPESANSSNEELAQLRQLYEDNHGNLIQVMLASNLKSTDNNDSILETLKELSSDEKFIVDLLYLNNGSMEQRMLNSIMQIGFTNRSYARFTLEKLNDTVNDLDKKGIVIIEKKLIHIKHDSILAALDKFPPSPILYTAYSELEEYYLTRKGKEGEYTEDDLIHLFFLYIKFSDDSIIDILPQLREIILTYKYPQEIIDKLVFLRQKLLEKRTVNKKNFYEIMIFIVQICNWAQNKIIAQECLDFIYNSSNPYLIALQGETYSIGSSKEDLNEIDKLILLASDNVRLKLTLQLCRLHIMMRTCSNSISSEYAALLINNEAYKEYLEYGFALTNYSEFTSSTQEAIEMYKQAINIFSTYGKPHLEAEVYISLCMEYAYEGALSAAEEALQNAQDIASNHIKEEIILNNKSVLKILSKQQSSSTIKDLATAMLLTANEYEQLIIRANFLVCCILEQQMDLAKQECIIIEKIDYEKYGYEEFLHIMYQNLQFYYDAVGNEKKAKYYKQKIIELINAPGTGEYTKNLASLILAGKKDEDIFYSNFPFRVDFLGYWGGEISRDLESL